ncbi:SDR family NAD(P)-dependent oxidoreductase [Devosia sp. Root635]|uniref:SDR family NAD(P)-dependent oxidoreductase n=1 Tax=Devosia sp. Root635 TaxID=1736575 RepID=UPI0006F782F5|nr:SDR family oxidoreductase [Devosia sp. Root635]KRA50338.1 short-chain dehydrogenase [Devosia sp. Root635]
MDLNLRDKVAVITGGTVGIGLAVAEGLAAEGANLVLVGRNRQRGDDEAARLAEKHGIITTAVAADVATADGCDAVISGVAKAFGGADILINNAGTGSNETIAEADDAKWQYYWDLHVMAAVRLARGLVPGMRQRGGGVVLHNASICAVQPLWYEPIYNTTKAALMMFSKTLANEVVGDNIRVNTINPGLVLTPDWIKTAKQIAGEDGWQAHLQGVADEAGGMKRFATPEELANFFVFMCSDRASYSTGSTYFVDGGWLKTV